MLEKRKYTRSELIDTFKTARIDAIRNKLQRAGYVFCEGGKAEEYYLEIIDIPRESQFKQYCIKELGFDCRTDFQKLKYFLLFFLQDDEFMTLQFNQMAQRLRDYGCPMTPQTVSSYFNHLQKIGWIYSDRMDFVYYLYDESLGETRYITKEEYKLINSEFHKLRIKEKHTWSEAYQIIKKKYGNKPRKRPLEIKTAFFNTQYQAVWDLIDDEIKQNKVEG